MGVSFSIKSSIAQVAEKENSLYENVTICRKKERCGEKTRENGCGALGRRETALGKPPGIFAGKYWFLSENS